MKKYFLLMLLIGQLAFGTKMYAQNIAINATGGLPDGSAMLDISSTNKGFLAPRMTTTQQNAIPLPATGLLLFNTTDNVFKVNTGTPASPIWTPLLYSGGAGSITSVNGLTNTTQTFATGTTGSDFGINSTGSTHTFNIPTASASNRGALSSVDWTIFNNKQTALGFTPYNATNPSGYISSSSIAGATDATISSPSNGQVLQYNLATGKWVNVTPSYLSSYTETDPVVKAINGIVKSNGTTISAATAGTDYLTPTGSAAALTSFPTFNQNTTGTAANVTGTVAIANGGTGQTTKITAFNALSPTTTLGDLAYHNGTNNVRLAGNTTATKKFLAQTGTGAVSAAPSWLAIANTDITGLGTLSGLNSVDLSGSQATGILAAARFPALTGDVTTASGAIATTITANAVTYAKMQAMTTNKLLGSGTGTAVAEITLGTGLSFTGTTLNAATTGGTVTNVAALTLGTTGTDLSSSVATGTTTPVITLNVPTASASNRGALSSADWSTFNGKQGAISFTTTGNNGAATFAANALNIPTYTLAGLGGISLTALSASAPLSYNNTTGAFTISQANTSTNGYLSNTDWNTFNGKQGTISGTANRITVASNAVDISSAYVGQTSLTTLGTIGTGTWNGTAVGATYGGTGQTTVATGDILYGSAANTWSNLSAGSTGQVLTIAGGIPSWSSNPGASAWSLTGNAVTAGSQFLGSTNNVSLRLRTNNLERMLIDSTGKVGIGTNALTDALNVNGNIALSTATAKVIGSAGNLTFEQNGDTYGTTRLSIQNRNGVNGAMFEQAGSVDLVDFVFKGLINQRNIRYENRPSYSYLANPEFQIGVGSNPTLVIADNASAFRKGNVAIGSITPTALLHIGGGTATAGTAPLKFTAGTNLTIPETGAMEYDGTHFYGTVGTTRYQLDQQGGGTVTSVSVATLNGFAGTSSGGATPVITLTTPIAGMLKGSANAIVAATAGADYTTPSSTETVTNKNLTSGTNTFPTFNQNTTGTSANVTGTVAIANGGTGQTTKTTAFDALSPTTTLGDLAYHNGTNNIRLAGNTTVTKKFLAQTGNGTISAAPSWLAIANTDITGLGTLSGLNSVDLSGTQATGILAAARFPALTGDVTNTAGAVATTIAPNAVTYAKMQAMTTNKLLGSGTGTAVGEITLGTGLSFTGTTLNAATTGGTVTSVSVSTLNGFAGTSSGGATPVITLTTPITGILKGSAGAIAAATAGTDYTTPSSTETVTNKNLTSGTNTFPTFNQNTTGTAANVTGTVAVANGGTGLTATPTNGQIDIGNGTGFTRATLTAGTGISVTNSAGGITINNTATSVSSFTGSLAGDVTGTQSATVVGKINGTTLSLLGTGILKNTTSTGVPSIAVAGTDYLLPTGSAASLTSFPTFNQNTTGTAANVTGIVAVTNGGTGLTSVATGELLYGSAANTYSKLPAGTNGQVLTLASGVPSWASAAAAANAWSLTGNVVTAGSHYLGSSNNVSLRMRTNNTERMVVDSIGNVGIGVTNPAVQLVVKDEIDIRRTGTVSQLIFTNTAGSGDFRIGGDGGDIYWQGGGSRSLQMGSYWPTILGGDRQTATFPAFIAGVGGTSVIVASQRDASVALGIQGNSASQAANLTEWRNSAGTAIDVVDKSGNMGIGVTVPTAVLHLGAGSATAGTAPLKLTSGTNLTTPENGAVEFNGTHFFGTIGTTRYQLDQQAPSSFTGSLAGDVTGTQSATVVGKINGTALSGLGTGILKNTTGTGVPSIAVASDFPTLNQNTTGNAATVTTNANLTGPITSVGNATSIASQTGTGTTFVMSASPTLTGTPLAPTASAGTNTTQIATTAFVNSALTSTSWALTGNSGTTQPAAPATYGTSTFGSTENFIGTKDTKDLVLGAANLERMRILNSNGFMGIGTATPSKPIDLVQNLPSNGLMKIQNTSATGYSSIDIWSNTTQVGNIGFANNGATYSNSFYFATNTTNPMVFATNNTQRILIDGTNGNMGVGLTTATAALHIKAGTATAGTAPLKLTSGVNLTTPESGAIEYDGTHFYGTAGATRYQLDQQAPSSFTGSLAGDVTGTQSATVVGKINGTALSGLATGILKNTTSTGVPSIAVAADFPTLNQNTTGTAANVTGTVAVANGGTGLTTVVDGGILYGASTSTMASTALGTTGQVLQSAGTGIPVWVNGGTMMFSGNTLGATQGTNKTFYYPINGTQAGNATYTAVSTASLMSRSGTIAGLVVKLSANATSTTTYTIFKNGTAQSMTISVTTGNTTGSTTTNPVSFVAGDEIAIRIVTANGGATAVLHGWACDVTY